MSNQTSPQSTHSVYGQPHSNLVTSPNPSRMARPPSNTETHTSAHILTANPPAVAVPGGMRRDSTWLRLVVVLRRLSMPILAVGSFKLLSCHGTWWPRAASHRARGCGRLPLFADGSCAAPGSVQQFTGQPGSLRPRSSSAMPAQSHMQRTEHRRQSRMGLTRSGRIRQARFCCR